MRTKLTTFLLVSLLTQVSAQSNWITRNFKTYLANGNTREYVNKSESLLNEMSDYGSGNSYYALELFKIMSGYNNTRLPICHFNRATSAVGLSVSSKYLNGDVSLKYCIGQELIITNNHAKITNITQNTLKTFMVN